MANTKARCSQCKGYFPQPSFFYSNNVQRLCTEACFNEWRDKSRRPSPTRMKEKRAMRRSTPAKIPIALRMSIRARDHNNCRWCGVRPGFECHHIHYRSEGGSNDPSNLILLCQACHVRAHSSKQAFKPLLLACLWLHYVEGREMTVAATGELLGQLGLLSELQTERLAG